MPILDAQQLHKAYGPRVILGGVSLTIEAGERIGLVGINGSGKSTLARILAGIEEPDTGNVARRREAKIAYLSQVPVLDPRLTAREEVLSGLTEWMAAKIQHASITAELATASTRLDSLLATQTRAAAEVERLGGWDLEHRAEAILGDLRIRDPHARVGTMSGGEQRRVALARILVTQPDVALLDEPTNHLDIETIEWLEAYLRETFRGALLLVTHDRYVLDRVAQRTLELERGQLISYPGSYEQYLELKSERLALENRVEANRQNYLRRELEWLRRQPKARTGKQKARIQRTEEVLCAPKLQHQREVALRLNTLRSGKTILELTSLCVVIGDRVLVSELDLALTKGQRVGILGPNGCGKTTLLRTIVGELEPSAGSIRLGKNAAVSYLSQARGGLEPDKTVLQNVSGGDLHVVVGGQTIEVQSYLGRFLFPADSLQQPVSALSGGEKTRVALARLLLTSTNLVILDEPANDLDVPTLSALEQMLIEFNGTALVVTHDRWFLDRVATDVLAFEEEGHVVLYAGNYSAYRAQRARAKALEMMDEASSPKRIQASPLSANNKSTKKPRQRRALTYAERLELESIEAKVEAADERVAELEARLADPQIYQVHPNNVSELMAGLEAAKREAARLFARWEELETKQEGEV